MTFSSSSLLRPLALLLGLVLSMALMPRAQAEEKIWEVVRVDGRDYVTARSMQRFYGFQRHYRLQKKVVLETAKILVTMKIGDRDCFMNGVKFVFSHPVLERNGQALISRMDLAKLVDPVLRPNYIKNAGQFRTVIIDPGHGGKDAGATNSIGREKVYNLAVARRLKMLLEQQGYRVIMTRDRDVFLSLDQRVKLANAVKEPAIFISIHFNSGKRKEASGIETFTLSPPGVAHYGRGVKPSDREARKGNANDSANIALATAVHGSILRNLTRHTVDRGIKRARFNVLTGVHHPAILLEGGFLTNPFEAKLVATASYQQALAHGIVEAIAKYRAAVGGGARGAVRVKP